MVVLIGVVCVSSLTVYGWAYLEEEYLTVGYDPITKTQYFEQYKPSSPLRTQNNIVAPYYGVDLPSEPCASYPFPPDDRQKIMNTASYPWRTICKLYITAEDDSVFIGTGAIIDELHILTAGHCVYIHENGGLASQIKIIPGMDGSYEPYGHTYASYMRTYTGWIEDEMEEHDWAVVTLQHPLGNQTGWMGLKTLPEDDPIYWGVLNLAGYPGDLDGGEFLYYDSDNGEEATEFLHYYWMDTAAGQSGSPVWEYDGENRYILSINAYEFIGGAYANFGTRLNQEKFDRINIWLAQDNGNDLDTPSTNPFSALIVPIVVVGSVSGVAVIVGIVYYHTRRKRKARFISTAGESEQTNACIPTADIDTKRFRDEPIIHISSPQFSFCPMCGQKITIASAKFCPSCGYRLYIT